MEFTVIDIFKIKNRGTVLMLQPQRLYAQLKIGSQLSVKIQQQEHLFTALNVDQPCNPQGSANVGILVADSDMVGVQRTELIGQTLELIS
jgi:hypothetical protein